MPRCAAAEDEPSEKFTTERKDPMTINIKDLTLGQLDELRALLGILPATAPKSSDNGDPAVGTYVIVRCRDAGVHAGEFVSHPADRIVVLKNSRRIYYWSGAASLSELAVYGAKNVSECRFGVLDQENHPLLDACEIIVCQEAAKGMIVKCPEWRA
jgi:hypothetical protein